MAEDTTESDKSNEPKKTQTRKRTTAAGLVLSGMSTMLDVAAQAAARAESMQKMVDSLMPFEQPTPDGMELLVGIPAYRKLDAIAAASAANVDQGPPASDRGPGEQRKPSSQGKKAKATAATAPSFRKLTAAERKLVEKFLAAEASGNFPGIGIWAGQQPMSERHLLRLRTAYRREAHSA